ncbi:ribosome recycling factor family protein [Vibrio ziniensis]|uniref:Ribosome recycling factor n=1 Tax=Vibrio ziniensis TaxID=2711221 RepID=A0A6G7CQC7_9VIBR|nr:ribosome recycling factor family protein [Vibrio ziniensis]QIH44246.1 ribosome recycling factor [Vibrio ziniensis]
MTKKNTEREKLTIHFPSLVRRIGGEKAKELKAIALEHQCELKRIRRSRNWKISGFVEQLCSFNQQIKGDQTVADYPFVAQKIADAILPLLQASLPDRLAELIANNQNITLAELMEKTGCTVTQARLARENVEFGD